MKPEPKSFIHTWFCRVLLSHIMASYIAWAAFWLAVNFILGDFESSLGPFLLAPVYVPYYMGIGILEVIFGTLLRITGFYSFDIMAELMHLARLWLAYLLAMYISYKYISAWAEKLEDKAIDAVIAKAKNRDEPK